MTAEPLGSQPQGRVAAEAYQRALKTYKESLSAKEYAKITVPVRLDDVIKTADSIQARHKASKTVRLCENLRVSRTRLERFNTLVESALKIVTGGELLWASINFVFIIASDSAETFAKLLEVLVTIAEKMPQFEILANTFGDSTLVLDSAEALYVAIIKFWVGAAKFYRKKRLWRLPLWNDYPIQFKDLVDELDKQERRLRDTAQIRHMQEAKEERTENRSFWRQGTFARITATKIIKWLSPADIYEPDFFEVDFEKANKKRHRGTCEWILKKPLYTAWEATPRDKGALLVIYGIPGAGKTILSSFLVAHCIRQKPPASARIGLYFYFDNKDEHKRSPLSAARSLVYQLYTSLKERNLDKLITQELEMRIQNSANERAMSYERLWAIFKTVILSEELEVVVVLDAMDECNGPKPFIRDLRKLVATATVRIVITSRNDTHIAPGFSEGGGVPTLYVTTEDVKRDIVSFVQAKVGKSATLQHPQVKDKVVTGLATKSGGMFLWVYLMLKVLKHLPTVAEILHALSTLPEKLDDVYGKILLQLQNALKPGPRAFCQLVLKWIVSTSRPLLFTELVEALKTEYNKTSSMFDQESGFQNTLLYGRKDIELVCGSLVTVNEDSIRLIHLSTRDYLRSNPQTIGLSEPLSNFLVDVPLTQNRIALVCLEYLASPKLVESPNFAPSLDRMPEKRRQEIANLSAQNALFEYAVLYWPHYIATNCYSGTNQAMDCVDVFLHSKAAITWLEVYLSFSGPEFTASTANMLLKIAGARPKTKSWLEALHNVLDDYASTMTQAPQSIHYCLGPINSPLKDTTRSGATQYTVSAPIGSGRASGIRKRTVADVEKGAKSWIHMDLALKMTYMTQMTHPSMRLASQSLKDGTRYRPAIDAEEESPDGEWAVRSVAVRPGGSHIAVTFCPTGTKGVPSEAFYRTVVWLIKDPLKLIGTDEWAERILVDKTASPIFRCAVAESYITEGRGSVISFADNGTLLTPGGIYNIFTEERLNSPAEIFLPTSRITATSFNSHRIARIRDLTELEVLSLDAQIIAIFSFPGSEVLHVCTMGYTGQKIIMTYTDVTARKDLRRIVCVHVKTGEIVRLQSKAVSRLNFPLFTSDEERIVGRVSCNPDHSGSEFAIWNVATGDVTYLFKDSDPQSSFCLYGVKDCKIVIVSSTGQQVTRDISKEWTLAEEAALHLDNNELHQGTSPGQSDWTKLLWQIVGNSEIWALHCACRASDRTMALGKQVWSFEADTCSFERIHTPIPSMATSSLSMSANGQLVAALGKMIQVSKDGLHDVPLEELPIPSTQVYLSPGGRFILFIDEENVLRPYKAQDESSTLSFVTIEPYRLDGYVMDLNIIFHGTAPMFVMTYTSMSPYTGEMMGVTYIAVITEEGLQCHNISRTFHPSCGFSHCGKYFFGTVSMDEHSDPEIYDGASGNDPPEDEQSLESDNSDAEVDIEEPNFDEEDFDESRSPTPSSDEPVIEKLAIEEMTPTLDRGIDIVNNSTGFEEIQSSTDDTDSEQNACIREAMESSPHELSSSAHSDNASNISLMDKYQWPRLYELPSELQKAVPRNEHRTVHLKLGSFYLHHPYICRLRVSENMGFLYLDRLNLTESGIIKNTNDYRSRVLCIIPDAFLDLSTTEIILVWPRNQIDSADATMDETMDWRIKVVLFPSTFRDDPLLVCTGLHGPTLLNF